MISLLILNIIASIKWEIDYTGYILSSFFTCYTVITIMGNREIIED